MRDKLSELAVKYQETFVIEKICCYFPAGTRPPEDIPWKSPNDCNVQELQGTFRGLLVHQQKNDDVMKKVFFRCNSICFTHLLLIFTGKTNIQKF